MFGRWLPLVMAMIMTIMIDDYDDVDTSDYDCIVINNDDCNCNN